MTRRKIIVASPAALKEITNRITLYKTDTELKVAIPELNDASNQMLTAEYNKYINGCGCNEGMISGFIASVAFFVFTLYAGHSITFLVLVKSLGFFIAGAICGKLFILIILLVKIKMTYDSIFNP